MDAQENPFQIVSLATFILVLLLNCQRALTLPLPSTDDDDLNEEYFLNNNAMDSTASDQDAISRAALQHWRLWNSLTALDEELGYWVKPRSTAWFSKFLLEEYEDERWIKFFRMTKRSVLTLAALLRPAIQKRNTNYRMAVPVAVRLGCTLFKICQGASLMICSELFAVGRTTVSIMLREVIESINVKLRNNISWPTGDRIHATASEFQQLCGLPGVLGAIDGTHFAISKPKVGPSDYYYFKTGGYSMQCQAVVDASKRFLDLHVGMPGSVNDSRVLRRSTLYDEGQRGILWEGSHVFHGYSPYLLGDAGFPLLPWLMVPHRQQPHLAIADSLFNRKLSKGRAVVENAFAQLKLTFRELHHKSDLHVTFLPDVVVACGLLHNLLLQQSHDDVEALLEVLRSEGLEDDANLPDRIVAPDVRDADEELPDAAAAVQKRSELGVYLSLQRTFPT